MENKEIELLPCPFCGGAAKAIEHEAEDSKKLFYITHEDHIFERCDFFTICCETLEGAASKWNRRTPAITTVDLASADASGYRNGRESVVVELPNVHGPDVGVRWSTAFNSAVAQCKAAIIAAGGSVKE